jgi:hypothetical protein
VICGVSVGLKTSVFEASISIIKVDEDKKETESN